MVITELSFRVRSGTWTRILTEWEVPGPPQLWITGRRKRGKSVEKAGKPRTVPLHSESQEKEGKISWNGGENAHVPLHSELQEKEGKISWNGGENAHVPLHSESQEKEGKISWKGGENAHRTAPCSSPWRSWGEAPRPGGEPQRQSPHPARLPHKVH